MPENINPGDRITVKIVKEPTNTAARKTLQRLLGKDPEIQREKQRQRDIRRTNANPHQRGGRIWVSRVPKQEPVAAAPGETGNLLATLDVIRDLASVQRFVEVSRA